MQSNKTPFLEAREALAATLYAASAQEGGDTDHDLSEAEAGYYADIALGYLGDVVAEARRVADVRLERITQLLDEPTLTPDERDWLIMVARMARHETEHPTAVKTLRQMRVAVQRSDCHPPAGDVRGTADGSLSRLREVWDALGCEQNPNDFHLSVQQTMWAQAIKMVREATARTSRVHLENQQLEEALRLARSSLPTTPTDDVREALAATIAKTFPGWSGETLEPHNQSVNEECVRQGRVYADAILADFEVHPSCMNGEGEQTDEEDTMSDDCQDAHCDIKGHSGCKVRYVAGQRWTVHHPVDPPTR